MSSREKQIDLYEQRLIDAMDIWADIRANPGSGEPDMAWGVVEGIQARLAELRAEADVVERK